MRIDEYFAEVAEVIEQCPFAYSSTVTYDRRSTHEGFLRGEIYFVDGSQLHIREFVSTGDVLSRLIYAYHFVDAASTLVFRYDNTPHHRKLNLRTFPHHKHEGSESRVAASPAPTLSEVLQEISAIIQIPGA